MAAHQGRRRWFADSYRSSPLPGPPRWYRWPTNWASSRRPRPITFQFGSAVGSANGPYGIRVRGVPGTGDIVGSVERTIEQDGVKVRAALVDDPFFFDSQGLRESREMGTLRFRNDRDFFAAQNITSVVIEVPRNRIENGTHVLDIWSTADRLGGQL
jgi:hypothetical protein